MRLTFKLMSGVALCATLLLPSATFAQKAKATDTKKVTWAHIKLSGTYPEGATMPGLFGELAENLSKTLSRLDKAAKDDAVKGVILKVGTINVGWAKLNELRTAIQALRKSGKTVIAHMNDGDTRGFLVATACDKIVMPESGSLMLLGMRAEVTFYKNLFDKLDIKADMLRVGEFKSAAEPYTRTEMSAPFREEMEAVLDDYYDQLVSQIASDRKLDRKKVMNAIDSGPHTAKGALELGLIDKLAYSDEIETMISADLSDGAELKIAKRYGKKNVNMDFSGPFGPLNMLNVMLGGNQSKRRSTKPKVAIIHATGMIMPGSSTSSLMGGSVMGSDTMVKAIRKAASDKTVKAIVLRVDSPGGSALASDLIWRALEKADKPVVASMGDTAASGGYYISMGADTIFAEPGTLTGSIGVVGGKLAFGGLLKKIGVTTSVIQRGKNSAVMSVMSGFSDSERAAMQKMLYDVYDQFTSKAAAGRKMNVVKLEKLARGRVYTGNQALKLGLVDKLGTLEDAVAHAKKLAGLTQQTDTERMILPEPANPLEMLLGPVNGDAQISSAADRFIKRLPRSLQSAARHLNAIELLANERVLTVMPYDLLVH